jgi:hypothetical protein
LDDEPLEDVIPPRIAAAQDFLEIIFEAEGRSKYADPEDGRELDDLEIKVKKAALNCLLLYFNGENNFGGPAMYQPTEDPGSVPETRHKGSKIHGS